MPPRQGYRLQPLLNFKARLKKNAEIKLGRAIGELEKRKKRLKELEEEKKEIIRRRRQTRRDLDQRVGSGAGVIKDSQVHINFLRRLEEEEKEKEGEIENQRQLIEEGETAVKRARRGYIDAAKELRVMEKHKELWRKKVQAELSRREEDEMDELGRIIHHLRQGRDHVTRG